MEKERDELREALDMIESHLGTCARQYDSEDGTRPSRVKKTAVTRTLRSVSRKGARTKEPEIVDLGDDESVSERVARLIALPVMAGGSSSPQGRRPPIRQSPRFSGKSDKSTVSDMRSGSMPKSKSKLKSLSFAEALVAPTPEEQKARERVDAKKRRNKKPEEVKDAKKKEAFIIRQSFDNIGRELISLISTTLREIGKIDIESPTPADNQMLLPLAQKMCKVFARCEDLTVQTELVEGLGNTYGYDKARKESLESYLSRMLYQMFYHEKPFQAQLGVMAFLEAHE